MRPIDITVGPDHALWFTEEVGNKIGRITISGVVSEYPVPTGFSEPEGITSGPDHQIWFIGAIRFAETNEIRSGMASKEVKNP